MIDDYGVPEGRAWAETERVEIPKFVAEIVWLKSWEA